MEVTKSLLTEKYRIAVDMKDPSVIYLERSKGRADFTVHMAVVPNPLWASAGLSVTPLPIGGGAQYESKVSLGYLNQSFQNAVADGVHYGLVQGMYGWKITDCKICFEYGAYSSPPTRPSRCPHLRARVRLLLRGSAVKIHVEGIG